MENEWLYIGLFLIVGVALPAAALVLAWLISPKKSNPIKDSTYECGMETVGESWVQFKAQYYIFGLVFLVFDVEMVFLFPWAVSLGKTAALCGCGGYHLHPYPRSRVVLYLA
jgi:NADH:ubiquinone oxidoreductase subunit 3 (subunit A)